MQHLKKAIFTLLVMFFVATQGFSLTNGPIQPEYSSFEPVDAIDLVNTPRSMTIYYWRYPFL